MANERGKILDEAKTIINGPRQDMYGNPEDSFEAIADFWAVYEKHSSRKHSPAHDAAMKMALMKVARICTGTGGRDSYVDLCGYVALAADIAEKVLTFLKQQRKGFFAKNPLHKLRRFFCRLFH